MTTNDQLLTLLLNSKKGDDLPVISSLSSSGKIIVYDPDTQLVSTILKSNFSSASAGSSTKEIITATDGQTTITPQGQPDNVDVVVNRSAYIQDLDYAFNSSGVITFTTPLKLNSKVSVRGYQNAFSKKQTLVIDSEGQTIFNLSELPKNIDVNKNRTSLIEDTDYTYNNTTGVLTFTKATSLLDKLTVRKIF